MLVLFRADGGQKTTVIRGVTACSSGIGSMNNYYTWVDSGVSWYVNGGNTMSVNYQMNASGKTYHYLIIGYAAEDEAAE